ncbi:MAG TPA: hypothetical protein VFG20_20585 [Planctomycetaceae bacterium]|jgi:hypothetical protein|nr:hypothetical protein [Planctomycetaceae bacterium]
MSDPTSVSRRNFLATGALSVAASTVGSTVAADKTEAVTKPGKPLRVAAINSIYRLRSHAYHICGRVIHGYTKDGFHHQPALKLVRMYNDQYPKDDLGRAYGKQFDVEVCDTVAAALGGPKSLDVDAVLLIIEHGDYPLNELGQVLYPRYELFQQIVDVFRASGRSVPVFVDKHLSYDHRKAAEMVRTAHEMKFGLMAGSSLPVTWRIPEREPPLGTPFREAVVTFGFDRGSVEIYLFHALESLQCMLERRKGGETGVKSVQTLRGNAVWEAAAAGRFSTRLMETSLKYSVSNNVGSVRDNVADPLAVLIEYHDGTKGAVINLIEQTSEFAFAANLEGHADPVAFGFYLPAPPAANFFNPLTWNIEQFFLTGQSPYPVERTLLTSTLCDLAMQSLHKESKVIESPAMHVQYQSVPNSGFFRGSPYNGI